MMRLRVYRGTFPALQTFLIQILTLTLILGAPVAVSAEPPTPDQIDGLLSQLTLLDPANLAARVNEMKSQAAAFETESAQLKQKAQELETRVTEINGQIANVSSTLKALFGKVFQPPAPAVPSGSMEPAPDIQMAAMETVEVISYEKRIRPVFEKYCFRCHDNNKRKSGLSLQTHAYAMEGGSSGPVVVPGDPDGSRLFRLISGAEKPPMPPSGDKLDKASIELIRQWIDQGAPATQDSEVLVKKENTSAAPTFVAATFSDGPPPMPEVGLAMPDQNLDRGVVARALAINPRSPLAAVAGYRNVWLYNLETAMWLGALPFPEGEVDALTFSVNGELLLAGGGAAGDYGLAVLYNVRTGERLGQFGEEYDTILAADISPDHKMIALGGPDCVVRVYSAESAKLLFELDKHTDWILSVKFTPDGEVLASADRQGGLQLWQASNGRHVEELRGHKGAIHDLAYTADSVHLASAGEDKTVQVWDTWKYSRVRSISAHDRAVTSVDYTPEGDLITTGADRKTKRWAPDGSHKSSYENLPDWGYRACYDAQTQSVLSGCWNGEISVWKAEDGEKVATLTTIPRDRETTAMANPQ